MVDFIVNYQWEIALVYALSVIVLMRLTNTLPFKIPDIEKMRQWNKREDSVKRKKAKYRPIMKQNAQVGKFVSLLLILIVKQEL